MLCYALPAVAMNLRASVRLMSAAFSGVRLVLATAGILEVCRISERYKYKRPF